MVFVSRGSDDEARSGGPGRDPGADDLPPVPVPPWSARRRRPAATGREPLSRERIADAAMAIIDGEGLDALSMRRVASDLGTGPASLYAHVTGKDDLLDLLLDRVITGLEVPEPDPARWEEQVKECVRAVFHGLAAHRDLARASLGRIPTGEGALGMMDRFLALLRAGDLPDQVVAYASDLLPLYATVYAYEQGLFATRAEGWDGDYQADIGAYFASLPPERFPTIAALAGPLMHDPEPDTRFEFGLDVLVRGLSAMREPPQR